MFNAKKQPTASHWETDQIQNHPKQALNLDVFWNLIN